MSLFNYHECRLITQTHHHIQYVDMLPWHSFIFSIMLICCHDILSYSVLCWYVTMTFLSHSKLSIYNTKSAGPVLSQIGPIAPNWAPRLRMPMLVLSNPGCSSTHNNTLHILQRTIRPRISHGRSWNPNDIEFEPKRYKQSTINQYNQYTTHANKHVIYSCIITDKCKIHSNFFCRTSCWCSEGWYCCNRW